jgi:hypothetical protein
MDKQYLDHYSFPCYTQYRLRPKDEFSRLELHDARRVDITSTLRTTERVLSAYLGVILTPDRALVSAALRPDPDDLTVPAYRATLEETCFPAFLGALGEPRYRHWCSEHSWRPAIAHPPPFELPKADAAPGTTGTWLRDPSEPFKATATIRHHGDFHLHTDNLPPLFGPSVQALVSYNAPIAGECARAPDHYTLHLFEPSVLTLGIYGTTRRAVIRLRYGVKDGRERSPDEIAKALGMSKRHIQDVLRKYQQKYGDRPPLRGFRV